MFRQFSVYTKQKIIFSILWNADSLYYFLNMYLQLSSLKGPGGRVLGNARALKKKKLAGGGWATHSIKLKRTFLLSIHSPV